MSKWVCKYCGGSVNQETTPETPVRDKRTIAKCTGRGCKHKGILGKGAYIQVEYRFEYPFWSEVK